MSSNNNNQSVTVGSGFRSRSSPLCWGASSSPSKQSSCPSPRASLSRHTPLLQRKLLFRQPGTRHTSDGGQAAGKGRRSLPVYFDSTSRRCGRRSRRPRRRSGSGSRACCSHTRTRLLLLKRAETGQRRRRHGADSRGPCVSHHFWFPTRNRTL